MRYVIEDQDGQTVSTHKNLELANINLRKIDTVKTSLHASDVDWLSGHEEALQGYNHIITIGGLNK